MITYILQRDGISDNTAAAFANKIFQLCGCTVRVVTGSNVDNIISNSAIDELIDLHIANKSTIECNTEEVKEAFSPVESLYDIVSYTNKINNPYHIKAIIGVGLTSDTIDDIDLLCDSIKNIITIEQHNWIKDEKGWWSRAYSHRNLCHITKNNVCKMYYVDDNHYMQTGWHTIQVDGIEIRLYFDPEEGGEMKTGWRFIDNTWYYFDEDFPHIFPSKVEINGKEYEVTSFGALIGYDGEQAPTEKPEVFK